MQFRGGQHQRSHGQTLVVACRFWYELTDGYCGQFSLTMFPHQYARELLPGTTRHLHCMQNFAGALEYLCSWRNGANGTIRTQTGMCFRADALPLLVDESGRLYNIGGSTEGEAVFQTRKQAHAYMVLAMKRDLQYRGMRDDRMISFELKQDANYLLQTRVERAADDIEYERLRQEWDTVNRPARKDFVWSPEQLEALHIVRQGIGMDDEEARLSSKRFLFISGDPGSGKTAVLLHMALEACPQISVLIVCPTGFLVHKYKAMLPDIDGVENIRVDTIQGVLKYKRKGADGKVRWTPPSALRRIDLILLDEASQYEDQEWTRLFTCIQEQPHKPFCGVAADFQQLTPVVSGGLCEKFCDCMQSVRLKTVFRSTDNDHLVFLNRIRHKQPDRSLLSEYFGERHWKGVGLLECVQRGMDMARESGRPFTWLTSTNAGAAEVCAAALACRGITSAELDEGYECDPNSKSTLRILARPGIIIRLTRNFDKGRGFVNGATAEVCESLRGNEVFTARLIGSGNMVLVHPMEEGGAIFLPCCYGYATTIRRAQGADLFQGCIYMDQKKRAGRGYGYVAVSRFQYRSTCFLYGKLRRTDFLPVGPDKDDEVFDRGYESMDTDIEERGEYEWGWREVDENALSDELPELGMEEGNELNDFQ